MLPKHLRRVGLIAGCCLPIALAVIGLCTSPRLPAYNGHAISYWFRKLPITVVSARTVATAEAIEAGGRKYGYQHEKPEATLAAIQGIGTNGLPFIIRKLGRRETALAKQIEAWLFKCGVKRSLFPNAEVERCQAVTALLALGSLPPEATVQLRKLSGSGTNSISLAATYVLAAQTNEVLRSVLARFQ